jgi:hypothetical protein
MDPLFNCLAPIFILKSDADQLEQIATSVALQLGDRVFLLTAAHVTDQRNDGLLHIPTSSGIEEVLGTFVSLELPRTGQREDDKVDVAYIELELELGLKLTKKVTPLNRKNLSLFDLYLEGDLYTFAGFPWRKTKITKDNTASTTLTTYSGEAVSEKRYKALGYSPAYHTVIKFRRKKSVSISSGVRNTAPLPHGISGGGVFSWQKDLAQAPREPELRCTAVGHTYKAREHLLIGTRLCVYLAMIEQSHPDLLHSAGEGFNPEAIMMGIVWYLRDEWDELMQDFDDAESMPNSWEEWRNKAEEGIEEMAIRGKIPLPIEVNAAEIREFCIQQNLKNNGYTRSSLINAKMAEQLSGFKIDRSNMNHPEEYKKS